MDEMNMVNDNFKDEVEIEESNNSTNNLIGKVAIVAGAAVVTAIGAAIYKKHKNKGDEEDTGVKKEKRRFITLKRKKTEIIDADENSDKAEEN